MSLRTRSCCFVLFSLALTGHSRAFPIDGALGDQAALVLLVLGAIAVAIGIRALRRARPSAGRLAPERRSSGRPAGAGRRNRR